MGNGVLAFLAGAGTGYLRQREIEEDRALRKEDRAFLAEERNRKRKEWGKEDALQSGLENAAGKAEVVEGELGDQSMGPPVPMALMPKSGNSPLPNPFTEPVALHMTRPDTMDNRDVGLPENESLPNRGLNMAQMVSATPESDGPSGRGPNMAQLFTQAQGAPMKYRTVALGGVNQTYDSKEAAQAAADAYNKPEAMGQRVVSAYQKAGQPDKANHAQLSQMQLAEMTRKFKDSGIADALQKFRMGDKEGAVAGLKASGLYKIDGDVSMEPRDLDIPGLGKVPSYDLKFNRLDADGKVVPTTLNSHQVSMAMMPYEKALELTRKSVDSDVKHDARKTQLEALAQKLESQGKLIEATIAWRQAQTLNAQNAAGITLGREERLRFTTLFEDTGRRLAEAQKTLNTLSKDIMYSIAKPGSPEHAELQGLRDSIASLQEDKKLYGDFLKQGATPIAPAGAPAAAPGGGQGGRASGDSKQVHDERVAILQSELAKAQASGNTQDADAVQRELARLGVSVSAPAAQNPAKTPQPKPNVIQQLPQGAKQIGTSGGKPVYELPDGRRVVAQ